MIKKAFYSQMKGFSQKNALQGVVGRVGNLQSCQILSIDMPGDRKPKRNIFNT